MTPDNMRRGLPRVSGGEPWPLGGSAAVAEDDMTPGSSLSDSRESSRQSADAHFVDQTDPLPPTITPPTVAHSARAGSPVRQGLPRTVGGEPWPPLRPLTALTPAVPAPAVETDDSAAPAESPHDSLNASEGVATPGASRTTRAAKVLIGSAIVVALAGVLVLVARYLLEVPAVSDFLVMYPGATELPANAPVGIPAWLGWQHFFNVFLMVLILKSGLEIRRGKKPGAFWAPRRAGASKVSLTIWFHQAVDVLWLVNGAAFIVLLFVTGQWMRIVPTSWEIFPNAASALLQYVSFHWPTESGWVTYNSLQVLAYFTTVFIAAPLAAITGYRMSAMWPSSSRRASALFPMEWARAIHFPVMIYFCAFIAVHVFLVMTTGALRNLNHMYASRDSGDWIGFGLFMASLVLSGTAVALSRDVFIAPIARIFGSVTKR